MFVSRSAPPGVDPSRDAPGGDRSDAVGTPTSVDELTERGRLLATQIAALQAELATIAGQLRTAPGELGGATTRQWIAWQWGLTPAEAARCARAGERLVELPAVRVAFAEGRLSEGVVDSIVRVATPENEQALLETASVATGAQLQALLRSYRRVRSSEDVPTPTDEWQRRWTDDRGMWRASLCLTPEHGADLEAALAVSRERCIDDERAARRATEAAHTDEAADAPYADEATAAGAGATSPFGHDGAPRPTPAPPIRVPETEPWVRLAHDQLCGATNADGELPERFLTVVHVDEQTLAGDADGRASIDGIGAIDVQTALRILAQSWITLIVERRGRPVTATEPTRLATPAQRRALLARDRTCRFPGCHRTRRLRSHHVIFSGQQGPTVLWNLLLLCDEHHDHIHKKGYRVVTTPTTDPVWIDPRGRRMDPGAVRSAADVDQRPAPPRVTPRAPAAGDPLTDFAANVVIEHWLAADRRQPDTARAA